MNVHYADKKLIILLIWVISYLHSLQIILRKLMIYNQQLVLNDFSLCVEIDNSLAV